MNSTAPPVDNPFWQFSLRLYGHAGVAPACLRLQDRDGLDVNLLLYCCWAARSGVLLDDALLMRLEALTAGWRDEVIAPVRAVRRALKSGIPPVEISDSEALRNDVKRLELEAERLLQQAMWQSVPLPSALEAANPMDGAMANLKRYVAISDKTSTDALRADLRVVAGAVSDVSGA